MKISIITATYNSSKTIETALQSVIDQTYPYIEHIIVDGDSEDRTIETVESYKKNHNHIQFHSSPDQGIYDALNKGITMATGDVIGLLHSDDVFYSNDTIAQLVAKIKVDDADGVYGNLEYVSKEDTHKVIRYWKSQAFKPKLLQRGWMPAHPSLFLRKEIYEQHGNFDLSFKIAADYDFILRIFQDEELTFSFLNKTITKMRVGGASNRSLKNIIRKSQEDYRALKQNHIGGWRILLKKNISKIPQFFK